MNLKNRACRLCSWTIFSFNEKEDDVTKMSKVYKYIGI